MPASDPLGSPLDGVVGEGKGYVVLPRSVLDAMPAEWQEQFSLSMQQVRRQFGTLPWPSSYLVVARRSDGRFIEDPIREAMP